MNKKYLLSSVTAGIAFLYANQGMSQCVTTQDCTALGYTETSCPNGNGVKCPFGSKWFCGSSDDTYTENECMVLACDKLGFKYDCTGTGYAGGSGSKCNGKYAACNCAEGYGWKDGACVEKVCTKWADYTVSCSFTNDTAAKCFLDSSEMWHVRCDCRCNRGGNDGMFFVKRTVIYNSCSLEACNSLCKECAEWGLP